MVLMQCQATPAILGCMTVYLDVTEVQQYGLDILAKIATYKPTLREKVSYGQYPTMLAILGIMTVFLYAREVQQHGLDMLANI